LPDANPLDLLARLNTRAWLEARTAIVFEEGAAGQCFEHAIAPVLLVCSPSSKQYLERLRLPELASAVMFDRVRPNPSEHTVNEALEAAANRSIKTVIGLGGGSVMDVAKCVAALIEDGRGMTALGDLRPIRTGTRLIQIPTTAGSGSEVTASASLWEPRGRKSNPNSEACRADVALVDSTLSVSMSARLTAATGLDAMVHAIEAIWGRAGTDESDAFAHAALRLIGANLLIAVSRPTPGARRAMSLAALLAGLALSRCRSAAAHALSYRLTSDHGLEHGFAVALMAVALAPAVFADRPKVEHAVDRALQLERGRSLQEFVCDVLRAAGVAPELRAFGVEERRLADLALSGLAHPRFANQPGAWDAEKLVSLLTHML
jgi:alcohol dehydrogenase class IV